MEKREYEPPTFEIYGTLTELTEAGNNSLNSDALLFNNPNPPRGSNIPGGRS